MPDGAHVAAGATFNKTWRLRNSGPCVWTIAYTLRFISGETMGGGAVNLPSGVPPGATVDISVSMVAPSKPGTYVSHWQMFTPAGVAFGTKPFVEINVP
jgi:next-to-BRCA1 protein 1